MVPTLGAASAGEISDHGTHSAPTSFPGAIPTQSRTGSAPASHVASARRFVSREITTSISQSATIRRNRAAGADGSSGTYAAPAFMIPYIATGSSRHFSA